MNQINLLIAKAKVYEKTQKAIAKRLGIAESKFADLKNGKSKPTPYEIYQLAEMAKLEPMTTFFEVMAELDKEHEKYWSEKIVVRSAGLEPTPQASELKTIHRALKLPYFIQCLQIAIKVCIAFSRRYIPMPKQVFNRINAYT